MSPVPTRAVAEEAEEAAEDAPLHPADSAVEAAACPLAAPCAEETKLTYSTKVKKLAKQRWVRSW